MLHKYLTFLFIIWILFGVFLFQGKRRLWDPDEGRYSCVALRIEKNGNWVFPELNGEEKYIKKPPLALWIFALSIKTFGKDEFAIRFPNSVALLLTVAFIYLISKLIFKENPFAPPIIYMTFLMTIGSANILTLDTILSMFEAISIYFFLKAFLSKYPWEKRIFISLFWISLGLAFLTKGPPSLILLLVIIIFLIISRNKIFLFSIFSLYGLTLFALFGLSWYIYLFYKDPYAFSQLLKTELYMRIFTGLHKRNPEWYGPFLVYLPTLILGSFPWTFTLIKNIQNIRNIFRKSFWRIETYYDQWKIFITLWFLIPIIVFSVAKSRLPLYILPLFQPLAFIVSFCLKDNILNNKRIKTLLILWIIAVPILKFVSSFVPVPNQADLLAKEINNLKRDHSIKEIVFINKKPLYSITFYTGTEVEKVELKKEGKDSLYYEIKNLENGVLFLCKKRLETKFKEMVISLNKKPVFLGKSKTGKFSFWKIEQ